MKKKGKFLKEEPPKSEKPKKNGNPMKVTAIVLSSLAAVLVLAAVGVGIFVWYSGSVRGAMFAARGSVSDTIPMFRKRRRVLTRIGSTNRATPTITGTT